MNISQIEFLNSLHAFPGNIQKILSKSVEIDYLTHPSYTISLVDSSVSRSEDFILVFCNRFTENYSWGFSLSLSYSFNLINFWDWKLSKVWVGDNNPGHVRLIAEPWRADLFKTILGLSIACGNEFK